MNIFKAKKILNIIKEKLVDVARLTWQDREEYNEQENDADYMLTTKEWNLLIKWIEERYKGK